MTYDTAGIQVPQIPAEAQANRIAELPGGKYSLKFEDFQLTVGVKIALTGDRTQADLLGLPGIWERKAEKAWNDKFELQDGGFTYPIRLDVEFVSSGMNADYVVTVHNGDSTNNGANALNWYTGKNNGNSFDMQGAFAAHEIGHLFGLYDEYQGGVLDPATMRTDSTSIMGRLDGDPKDRHFDHLRMWLEGKTGATLVLGKAPAFLNAVPAPPGPPVDEGPLSSEQLEGDYNVDGVVDAADYVVWQKGMTTNNYETWLRGFGQSLDQGSGNEASVPEPSTILYALLTISWLSARRRNCGLV